MATAFLRRLGEIGACAFLLSGCASLQTGSTSSSVDGDLPSPSGAVSNYQPPAQAQPATQAIPVAAPPTPAVASVPTNSPPTTPTPAPAPDLSHLKLVDSSLKKKLAVLQVGSEPTADHLLSVSAFLKNKTSHSLRLEVETIYNDNSGIALNEASWMSLTLKPHEQRDYHSTSISDQATGFVVCIRHAHAH